MTEQNWCRIDSETADKLREEMPIEEEVQDLASLFKVFGDPTRIRILNILQHKPLCVHDLSILLEMQQTAVSHQLKVLRHNRLVRFYRKGKMAIYSLNDEHIERLMSIGIEHIKEIYS